MQNPQKKTHGQDGIISKETQRRLKMVEGGIYCGVELKPPQKLNGMEGFQKFVSTPNKDTGYG